MILNNVKADVLSKYELALEFAIANVEGENMSAAITHDGSGLILKFEFVDQPEPIKIRVPMKALVSGILTQRSVMVAEKDRVEQVEEAVREANDGRISSDVLRPVLETLRSVA